ncbi:claudin-7-B-like [Erpetoichthys calabaricus]|uniref:Claudin n=1 Tax=Erpetoichthys calabaricus TaxID=27687 RepID=A0A8C4SH59_ERPCA|nr:claudin-7-B-like [Erpetoichthys calabaricus]
MANSGLQMLGFVLALIGCIGLIVGTIMPQWKMSAYVGDNIITAIAMYQGLWMSCAYQSTGQMQCKVYDSILQLDSALQATRALMVLSIILTVIGMGVSSMGMKCTNCGGDDKVRKARIATVGGVVFLLGGLASMIACCWFANRIVRDFYNPLTPVNTKYEFGAAIFIAWAGSFLVLLGGALMSCSCHRRNSGGAKTKYPPSKGRPVSSTGKDYV